MEESQDNNQDTAMTGMWRCGWEKWDDDYDHYYFWDRKNAGIDEEKNKVYNYNIKYKLIIKSLYKNDSVITTTKN